MRTVPVQNPTQLHALVHALEAVSPGIWSGGKFWSGDQINLVWGTVFPNLVLQKLWSGHGEVGLGSKSD